MSNDLQIHLQTYCAQAFPAKQDVLVTDLAHITAGWENELYSFTLEHGPATARRRDGLVLRIYPGADAHTKAEREFHGMSHLHQTGYPVPAVYVLEQENSPFGHPFIIMEQIEGRVLWTILFNSPKKKQQELLTLFCGLFVRLHALDWRPFVDDVGRYDGGAAYLFVDRWLAMAHNALEQFSVPGFRPTVAWLEKRRNELSCPRPAPIHMDFHPDNVLLRDDGSAVVIDWTGFDVSDPRFDLAWTLVLVSSYEGAVWRDRILQEYERLARTRIEQMECFEVFACTRRLFSVAVSLSEGAESLGMRPGAVTMMRQQLGALKNVYDLLLERTGIRIPEVENLLEE